MKWKLLQKIAIFAQHLVEVSYVTSVKNIHFEECEMA